MRGYSDHRDADGYASAGMIGQPEAKTAYAQHPEASTQYRGEQITRRAPLAEAITEAEGNLKRLEHIAMELCERLSPVLAVVPERPEVAGGYGPGSAPLIDAFNQFTSRVNAVADRLQSARDRLVL